tara:strand:- start:397 stop:837 length:441 start_codon:yes stop_codon:yes gene_type:complete
MEFSKKNIGKLREDLEKAFESGPVQELKQKLGIEFDLGSCRYRDTEATFKLTLSIQGVETSAQKDLQQIAPLYDLDTDKVASFQGKKIKLSGYLSNRRKWCWEVEYVGTDKRVLIATPTATRLFKKEAGLAGSLTETDQNGVPLQH